MNNTKENNFKVKVTTVSGKEYVGDSATYRDTLGKGFKSNVYLVPDDGEKVTISMKDFLYSETKVPLSDFMKTFIDSVDTITTASVIVYFYNKTTLEFDDNKVFFIKEFEEDRVTVIATLNIDEYNIENDVSPDVAVYILNNFNIMSMDVNISITDRDKMKVLLDKDIFSRASKMNTLKRFHKLKDIIYEELDEIFLDSGVDFKDLSLLCNTGFYNTIEDKEFALATVLYLQDRLEEEEENNKKCYLFR